MSRFLSQEGKEKAREVINVISRKHPHWCEQVYFDVIVLCCCNCLSQIISYPNEIIGVPLLEMILRQMKTAFLLNQDLLSLSEYKTKELRCCVLTGVGVKSGPGPQWRP